MKKMSDEMRAFIINESKKMVIDKSSPRFEESVREIVKDVSHGRKVTAVVEGKLFTFFEKDGRLVSEEII